MYNLGCFIHSFSKRENKVVKKKLHMAKKRLFATTVVQRQSSKRYSQQKEAPSLQNQIKNHQLTLS
jgi:hypothetical protein